MYVAWRTDVEPPTRMADVSIKTLLKRLRKRFGKPRHDGAEVTVAKFDVAQTLPTMCQIFVDITQLPAEASWEYRVNDRGWLVEVTDGRA